MTVDLAHARQLLDRPPAVPVPGQLSVDLPPPAPAPPSGLLAAFEARTQRTPDGHRLWAAGSRTAGGVGRFQYAGIAYTAARAAFLLRTGRMPDGPARAACDLPGCCEPSHVDDRAIRQRDRAALVSVLGMQHRPPSCSHDPAVHARLRSDGRRYCDACNNDSSCGHGSPRCGAVPARPYPCGRRCAAHQPSATRPYYQRPEDGA